MKPKLNSKFDREDKEAAILGQVCLDKTPERIPTSRYNRYAKLFGLPTMNHLSLDHFEEELNNQAKQKPEFGHAYQVLYDIYNHKIKLSDVVGTNETHHEFQRKLHTGFSVQSENHQLALDLNRHINKNKRSDIRFVNQINSVLTNITHHIKDYAKASKYKPKELKTSTKKRTEFIIFSDTHVGCMVNGVLDKGSINNYNLSIAKHRWFYFVKKALQYAKANQVNHLTVVNLGDEIEGEGLRSTQFKTNQVNASEQYTIVLKWFLRTLSILSHYYPVTMINVAGNHSRIQGNFRSAPWLDSWTYVLENTLMMFSKGKHALLHNVNFLDNRKDMRKAYYKLYNKRYLFIHGDVFNFKPKQTNNISNLESAKEPIDYLLAGHFHCFKDIALTGGKRQIVVPSLEGHNTFSLSLGTPASNAAQTLLIASPKEDLQVIPINLSMIQN